MRQSTIESQRTGSHSTFRCVPSWLCGFVASWLMLASASIVFAQSGGGYTIEKSVFASGGGSVSGGQFVMSATIGQLDAGEASGGGFFLRGGFWAPAPSAVPGSLSPEPGGVHLNRFVGIVVPSSAAGQQTALRVTLSTLNHPRRCCIDGTGASCSATTCDNHSHCSAVPGGNQTCAHQASAGLPNYSAMQNNIRYVNSFTFPAEGGPLDCPDDGPPFNTSYTCATLGCEPEYRDWASDLATPGPNQPQVPGLIYITDDAMVPSSTLSISHISAGCGSSATANAVSPIMSEPRLWLKQRDPVPNLDAITVIDLSDVVDGGPQAKPYPASRTIDSCPHD